MTDRIRKDLRIAMIEQDMTQASLAARSGLKPAHVSDLLRGRRGSLGDGWRRMLDALGLELCVRAKEHEGS